MNFEINFNMFHFVVFVSLAASQKSQNCQYMVEGEVFDFTSLKGVVIKKYNAYTEYTYRATFCSDNLKCYEQDQGNYTYGAATQTNYDGACFSMIGVWNYDANAAISESKRNCCV